VRVPSREGQRDHGKRDERYQAPVGGDDHRRGGGQVPGACACDEERPDVAGVRPDVPAVLRRVRRPGRRRTGPGPGGRVVHRTMGQRVGAGMEREPGRAHLGGRVVAGSAGHPGGLRPVQPYRPAGGAAGPVTGPGPRRGGTADHQPARAAEGTVLLEPVVRVGGPVRGSAEARCAGPRSGQPPGAGDRQRAAATT
jgi:hypothetical protein